MKLERRVFAPSIDPVSTMMSSGGPADMCRQGEALPTNCRVLIVENEVDAVVELGEWLELKQIGYVAATRPIDALTLIANNESIEIVILDGHMSKMSGFDLIPFIEHRLPTGRNLRYVIITGHPSANDYEMADQLGVFAFFEKPIDLNALENALRACLTD